MKDRTKIRKAIQHLNNVKNTCFDLGFNSEYDKLLKIRNFLIKKVDELEN